MLNLFFPPVCAACHKRLDSTEKFLCANCDSLVQSDQPGDCPKCGSKMKDGVCPTCREAKFCFEFARSALKYKYPLPEIVHNLKYYGMRSAGTWLAERMAQAAASYSRFEEYSEVVPVPLHKVRLRERGFNQSALIARGLAKQLGKNYLNCVSRKRYTKSQTTLSRTDRLTNLGGAFKVKNPSMVRGKKVILVDDVFTTGSTLNEVSRALYEAGAAKVAGYTATRA